jgi:O-methyltransferase
MTGKPMPASFAKCNRRRYGLSPLPDFLAMKLFRHFRRNKGVDSETVRRLIPEASDADIRMMLDVTPYTMTGIERLWAVLSAVRYANRAGIEGDIVECGVWRGGNMMLAKRAAAKPRCYFLYDTYAGMSEPTAADVDNAGGSALARFENYLKPTHSEWAYASIEEVRGNFEKHKLLDDSVRFIKGKVEETLKDESNLPKQIAILRLDTDWYESTLAELQTLYPRLVPGGILIVDDYGHWQGARKAFDEYFKDQPMLLQRIDYTARMTVKR